MSGLVIRATTPSHHCEEVPSLFRHDVEYGSVWQCTTCGKQWINSRLFGGWRKKIFKIATTQNGSTK